MHNPYVFDKKTKKKMSVLKNNILISLVNVMRDNVLDMLM